MKTKSLRWPTWVSITCVSQLLLLTLLLISAPLWAQQSQILCNRDGSTAFVPPTIPANNLAVSTAANGGIGVAYWENNTPCNFFGLPLGCGSTNIASNVINANTTDFARVHLTGVAATASLTVTDGVSQYSGGNFAGFVIRNSALLGADLLGGITIQTYNNGSLVQESTASTLVGLGSSILAGATEVGFITSQPFDAIGIRFDGLASAQVYDVYYAVQRSYCTGPTPGCNVKTSLVTSSTAAAAPGYPAAINRLGSTGVSTFAINNPGNITDSDPNNAATIGLGIGLGSSAFVSVKDQVNKYNTNNNNITFAGFEIENNAVVGASLLNNITLTAYNSNTVVQSVSGSSSLAGVSLLSGNRQIIGFVPNGPFDEIQISFNSVVAANAGTTSIYRAVIERFCAGPALVCKNLTPLTNPTYPVYINSPRSGIDAAACGNCSITNTENVISATATTPATIALAASAGSSAQLSVANAVDTYPAGTFAGFEISSSTLANLNLAGSVQITLYNNGAIVQNGTGTTLLAGATVLAGTTSQTIGTVGQVPFDEIQISFNQLASANPLGTISIYRALIQSSCPTNLFCSQTVALNRGTTSAVIEGTRTGFSGVASINGSSILNPWNAVSPDPTDYATITNIASGGTTGSISVADPATVYPAGALAGFTIRQGGFPVSGALLPSLTIQTYLNGILQETSPSGSLFNLSLIIPIFGSSGTTPYNVGYYTTKPFDEIRLNVGSLVNALSQSVDVYGAFVDTRSACTDRLNPDFNVTTKNVPVSGNVSTNDKVAAGASYGTPVAGSGNPAGATITMNTDGTYTFTATNVGSYSYTVPVCASGQSSGCPTTALVITVLDPTTTTNPPVVTPDYASVQSSTATPGSVTINVRTNDAPGNVGGTLGTPTITSNPTNGSATVVGGNIVYTPAVGYIGDDILTYQVCETPSGLCATAPVVIHVTPAGSTTVSIGDDYASTTAGTPVSGNVLTNDKGTGLTVSNTGPITNSGGTLTLNSNGSYSFTPATGVTGPVAFTYTACDNATPASCGTATLHLLVSAPVPVTVSGTVFNDSDGGTINGTPANVIAGNTLYVSIVNPTTGQVLSTTAVQPNGTYSLTASPNASYSVVLSNAAQTVGSPVANTALTGAISTAEGITAAGDGTPDGATPITVTSGSLTGVNFGVDPLPTTGSGTATVINGGGTSAVTVPPSAFTSTSPSTDTAPGSVTAIRITTFPTNVTSLSVNGTSYTSGTFPVGGVAVPTNANGAPTVPIAVDPANDSSPVSFTFAAIDNAGKESTITGTATLNFSPIPDLAPIIYALPATQYNTTTTTVVVDVFELNNVATTGLITVAISKDLMVSLTFNPTATSVGGRPVNNSIWTFNNTNPDFYIFTTNQVINAGDVKSIGMTGVTTPGNTQGVLTISTTIAGGSGGEIRIDNNMDADKIDYFKK